VLVYRALGYCSQVCSIRLWLLVKCFDSLAVEDDTRTVVNHNPLPDITHEEFVSLLGPLLAPENYLHVPPSLGRVPFPACIIRIAPPHLIGFTLREDR
jgi:hypothetical protein